MASDDVATEDGYDLQMQTNHLAHFLLTRELFEALEVAAAQRGEARVVNHSSNARKAPYLSLRERFLERNGGQLLGSVDAIKLGGWVRYQQSKLANVVFTYAMHARLQATGSRVRALVCHPGGATTALMPPTAEKGIMKQGLAGLLRQTFLSMSHLISQSTEDGSMPLLQCCCDFAAKSGHFYGPHALVRGRSVLLQPESICTDPESYRMLWELSEKAIGANFAI